MSVDKNKAVINYLLQCSDIANSPLYFNLIDAKDNTIQIITRAEDKYTSRPFVDGTVQKQFTFTLLTFRSISDLEIVKPIGTEEFPNENVEELNAVQALIDWVQEQNDLKNFPDFGEECMIESIDTTTDNPIFDGIDSQANPPIAIYRIVIVIEYIDTRKQIYNK